MQTYPLAALILLFLFLLTGGCTSTNTIQIPKIPGLDSPRETISPLIPGTVDRMPSDQEVIIQVNPKDTSYATVTTLFAGGKGQHMVKDISVTLTRSDGVVLTGGLMPEKLSELTLQGTRGTDRITVDVRMLDGRSYRVVDQPVPFKNHG